MEIQRLGSIAPMAVPHRALKDVEIEGTFLRPFTIWNDYVKGKPHKFYLAFILVPLEPFTNWNPYVKLHFFVGYVIPKDTLVFSVLYHILRDPDYWPNPNSFKPERFLSPDGKQVIKEERFIPFGVGELR